MDGVRGYPYNGPGGGKNPRFNSAIWCLTIMKPGKNRVLAKNFPKQQEMVILVSHTWSRVVSAMETVHEKENISWEESIPEMLKQIMQIWNVKPRYQQSGLSLRYQIFSLLIHKALCKV